MEVKDDIINFVLNPSCNNHKPPRMDIALSVPATHSPEHCLLPCCNAYGNYPSVIYDSAYTLNSLFSTSTAEKQKNSYQVTKFV